MNICMFVSVKKHMGLESQASSFHIIDGTCAYIQGNRAGFPLTNGFPVMALSGRSGGGI